MKVTRSLTDYLYSLVPINFGVALILTVITAPAFANADDWKLVSAPPPPGPYRAVNLDPRIPTQGVMPSAGDIPRLLHSFGNAASDTAGIPAPAEHVLDGGRAPMNLMPQIPGSYRSMIPGRPPGNVYPQHGQYPGYMGRQTYGSMPPRGYFPTPPYQAEQIVPPPPVYDAMTQPPRRVYQGGAGR